MSQVKNSDSYENISMYIENENTCEIDDPDNDLQKILEEVNKYSNFEQAGQVLHGLQGHQYNQSDTNDWFFNADSDSIIAKSMDYKNNYTVKELLTICDYYGLMKEVRLNKFKKDELVAFLLDFEENAENTSLVYRRKLLWYFVHELKNDKFMKKYIFSSI